jgi:hypothetical protein
LPLFSSANYNSEKNFLWEVCVEKYSKASLTYETDKLVAISGIARAMQGVIGDRYVAGMWQSQLPSQLFWNTIVPGKGPSKEYVAPSWSWASVNAGVLFGYPKNDIRIVDCRVDLAGDDHFGQLKGGHITIEGLIAPLLIKTSKKYPTITTFRASFNITRFNYENADDTRLQWDNSNADTTISQLQSLYVLGSWHGGAMGDQLYGLILGKGYDNKFRRYGFINFIFSPRKKKLFLQASEYFRRYAENHDVLPLVCAENGKFLVTIY